MGGENSEPGFLVRDVSVNKFLVTFRQIEDALDQADNPYDRHRDTASQKTSDNAYQQHYDTFSGVAEDELVDTQIAEQDAKNTTDDFLVGAGCFFAHKSPFMSGFLWLLTK